MHILHTVIYKFPKVLTRRICLPIKRFLPWSLLGFKELKLATSLSILPVDFITLVTGRKKLLPQLVIWCVNGAISIYKQCLLWVETFSFEDRSRAKPERKIFVSTLNPILIAGKGWFGGNKLTPRSRTKIGFLSKWHKDSVGKTSCFLWFSAWKLPKQWSEKRKRWSTIFLFN